jgi:hypothetical protein
LAAGTTLAEWQRVSARRPNVKKHITAIGAWLFVAVSLSGCSAEVDEPASDGQVAASNEELRNWGGSTPGSCLDRCLSYCPTDAEGGIEAGCLLTCLGACSSKATAISLASSASMTTLAK